MIYHASPFSPKMSQNCCTQQVWTVPHSPEPLWVTLVMGKNPTQQPKIYSFPPLEKSPLNKLKSFAVKSFISSPSNSDFQVIILGNFHFQLQSFLLYDISNFRLYVHTCHANLTNQCLLNVVISMTKALNDQRSPKKNFHSLPLSNAILKTLLVLLLVFLFFYAPFFIFN